MAKKRETVLFALVLALIVSGCGSSPPQPEAVCHSGYCVRRAIAWQDLRSLHVDFELSAEDGSFDPVVVATFASRQQSLTIKAINSVNDNEGVSVLNGFISISAWNCSVSDKIFWADGTMTAKCGLDIPLNEMHTPTEVGGLLKIDINGYGFTQILEIKDITGPW